MIEFLPWSKQLLNDCLQKYKENSRLCILDVELGGHCNFRCKYCDTPKYVQPIQYDLLQIEQLIQEGQLEWLFLCGLGEPTATGNVQNFKQLLAFCKKHSVKCSVFTNIANFDDELYEYVEDEVLYPLFKLDSFNVKTICEIYHISEELALNHIKNILKMPNYVRRRNNTVNICASIVPSTDNVNELQDIVKWCIDNGIFPLIGDLEDAGKGQYIYNSLKVSDSTLRELKDFILNLTGNDYTIPICPSVLFGLHINYEGYIVVDRITGLSCHWFWLTEPQIEKLSLISEHSFNDLSNMVLNYRRNQKNQLSNLLAGRNRLVFGGCGGDIIDLLTFYLKEM